MGQSLAGFSFGLWLTLVRIKLIEKFRMSDDIDISKYVPLWTSELHDHVLLKVGGEFPGFLIYNKKIKRIHIIESNEVAAAVKEKMLKNGCVVVDDLKDFDLND